jgi:hypothetical protein
MAEREDHHAYHRVDGLVAAFRKRQRAGHHAEAERSDRARKNEVVLKHPAPKRDRAEDHRKREADLMDDRLAKDAARRRHQREQDSGRDAVHKAEARKPHRHPVEPGRADRRIRHCSRI